MQSTTSGTVHTAKSIIYLPLYSAISEYLDIVAMNILVPRNVWTSTVLLLLLVTQCRYYMLHLQDGHTEGQSCHTRVTDPAHSAFVDLTMTHILPPTDY